MGDVADKRLIQDAKMPIITAGASDRASVGVGGATGSGHGGAAVTPRARGVRNMRCSVGISSRRFGAPRHVLAPLPFYRRGIRGFVDRAVVLQLFGSGHCRSYGMLPIGLHMKLT